MLGLDLVRGNAVKVLLVLVQTLVSLAIFTFSGKVAWGPGLALAVGSVLGGYVGVHLTVLKGHAWIQRVVTVTISPLCDSALVRLSFRYTSVVAKPLSSRQIKIVRAIAALVDVLQFAIFPLMFQGLLSPVNTAVDVVMAIVFTLMIGWHWALIPTFVSELVPFLDLVPTWTAAVFLATRGSDVIDTTAVEVVSDDPKRLPPVGDESPR